MHVPARFQVRDPEIDEVGASLGEIGDAAAIRGKGGGDVDLAAGAPLVEAEPREQACWLEIGDRRQDLLKREAEYLQ